MAERVGYGALAVIVIVVFAAADAGISRAAEGIQGPIGRLVQQGSVLPLLVLALLFCGSWELEQLLAVKGARPHVIFTRLVFIGLVATPWMAAAGWLGGEVQSSAALDLQLAWLAVGITGTGVLTVARRNPNGAFRDMGATLIAITYLGFLGSFAIRIRCAVPEHASKGAWLLLIILLVTKASDIGGFFAGSALGRHKLIPAISPGKSVEGLLGGLVASALVAVVFSMIPATAGLLAGRPFSHGNVSSHTLASAISAPTWQFVAFGFAVSLAGQIGDFIESCFKRDAGSKDSGKILPRFGGILDLIDSPVFAMPVAWCFLAVWWGRF